MDKDQILNATLTFKLPPAKKDSFQERNFKIINWVENGNLINLNDFIKVLSKDPNQDVVEIMNLKDAGRRSLLYYACYHNHKKMALYLLIKGTDPFNLDFQDQNVNHMLCYFGRHECASLIANYERHLQRKYIKSSLKEIMNEFNFKTFDVESGRLVCPEKNLSETRKKFERFRSVIGKLFVNALTNIRESYKASLQSDEVHNRNPLHYLSLSNSSNCLKTAKSLFEIDLETDGYGYKDFEELFQQVQNLEEKKYRDDPRQYLHSFKTIKNFLLPEEYEVILSNFKHSINEIQYQILNSLDDQRLTPLHLAAFRKNYSLVQYLLKQGADKTLVEEKLLRAVSIDFACDSLQNTLLDVKESMLKDFERSSSIENKKLIDEKKTVAGIAPIHSAVLDACKESNYELLKEVILKYGADVNNCDYNGWTPLHYASKLGNTMVVNILLENRADAKISSKKGYTPVHIAALYNNHRVLDKLLEKPSEILIDHTTNEGYTALHLATKKGNIEAMEILLERNADLYISNVQKWNALHIAVFQEQVKAVKLLCKYDADFDKLRNMKNNQGKTPKDLSTSPAIKTALISVWQAAKQGDIDSVRKLVFLGEKVDEPTPKKKQTPLILASINNHLLVVKFLLENQADPNKLDARSRTAQDYAFDQNNLKIIKILDDYMAEAKLAASESIND